MFRTCGKSVLNESIDVIDEIEKFIKEYETSPTMPPLVLNKGKIYDSDTDLLNILDSDNDKRKTPPKPKDHQMPPKKRKFPEPTKKPVKKREECKRGRSTALKINKAQEECIEPKFLTCKRLVHARKRVIERVVFHSDKRKPKVGFEKSRCDAERVKNVIIKKEVIDLTSQEEPFFAYLKFAKESCFETAEFFDVTRAKARIVEEVRNEVTIYVPEIHFHVDDTCIDLTHDEMVIASEKELANRILPVVFDCHRIYKINKMANVVHSIEGCLTPGESTLDNFLTYNLISKHAASLGCALLATIAHIFVKNLNLPRFLEIISLKLEVQYTVSVKPKNVALYLYSMLHPQREFCGSKLARELLQKIDDYVALLEVKQEHAGSTQVVFTEEQLEQLRYHIEQYHVVVARQVQLMAAYNGFPGINREVKLEILNAQPPLCLQDIKVDVDVDVICIDD